MEWLKSESISIDGLKNEKILDWAINEYLIIIFMIPYSIVSVLDFHAAQKILENFQKNKLDFVIDLFLVVCVCIYYLDFLVPFTYSALPHLMK